MIGQENNKCLINVLVRSNYFPRFVLLVGNKGSGKKTLANYIADTLKCERYIVPDVKIATVRDIIVNAYKQKTQMLYIVPDIDGMSKEAQNAILKITEEPPNKARFVMTVEDINNVLPTIKSRAYTISMDCYNADDLSEYATKIKQLPKTLVTDVVLPVCENPGEINTFIDNGGETFYNFVDKVVDNVDNVEVANALKLLLELDMKDEGKGYNVEMFFKIFIRCAMLKATTTESKNTAYDYLCMIPPTSRALTKLKVRGANKNMIATDWIFNVRR